MELKINFLLSLQIIFVIFYCNIGISLTEEKVGIIIPSEVDISVGSELVLQCIRFSSKLNCDKIHETDRGFTFQFRNKTRVPSQYINQLNSSAIELRIPNAPIMSERFQCYCNGDAINFAYVYVGTVPQNVTNFDCLGYDFEYLLCSFTDSGNPVAESYYIDFSVSRESFKTSCEVNTSEDNSTQHYCNITGESGYYRGHDMYNFTLKINNSLGFNEQHFNVNQVDRMQLAKPNFTLVNSTYNSLTFKWTYKNSVLVKSFPKCSLQFEIKYLPELNKKTKNDDDFILYNTTVPDSKNNVNIIKLENLEYAYTWYDIRIRVRIKSPRDTRDKTTPWSESFKILSQTDPTKPGSPPKTDIGSFYIDDSNRKMTLYWETLPTYRQNGKDTEYVITSIMVDGIQKNLTSLKKALNTITYQYNASNSYEFHVKSKNAIGFSNDYSIIRIPKRDGRIKNDYLPRYFNKIFHNNSYELTWDEPHNVRGLVNYTIFWCKSAQESHTDCENSDEGSIHFVRVDTRNFTKPKKNINYLLNFGVSANYDDYSSGIVWALCTGKKTGDFDVVQDFSSYVENQTIKIRWNLDCVNRPILKGYNLTYCPFVEDGGNLTQNHEPNCTEPEKYVIIHPKLGEYTLKNLKPYQSYKLNIFMFSETKSGPKLLTPTYATTIEAAPSSPRNLKLVNRTSNYATIQWDVPENKNGHIGYYEIHYNDNIKKFDTVKIDKNSTTITYRLEHLKSYQNYKVYVIAYTISPSPASNDITFQTWVGQPDSLETGSSISKENNQRIITWNPPIDAAAKKISFYKITIKSEKGDPRQFEVISFVENNACTLSPVCETWEVKVNIEGAAVNAIPKEEFDAERFNADHVISACDTVIENETSLDESEADTSFNYLNSPTLSKSIARDLICKEDIRNKPRFINKYCGDKEYKFLSGNAKTIHSFECNFGRKEWIHLLFIIMGALTCLAFVVVAAGLSFKKIKKMRNIDFVLPPGLIDQVDKDKDTQNKQIIEKQTIEKTNENLRLLSGIENGSTGYINGSSGSEKSFEVNCSNDAICKNEDAQSGNSMAMSEMSNHSNSSSRSQSPNSSDTQSRKQMNYILPSDNILRSTADDITTSNGYVQQSVLQKHPSTAPPIAPSGYTQLEILTNKPTIITNPMPAASIDNSNYVNPNSIGLFGKQKLLPDTRNSINPTLVGYVTHKQLSDYGQHKMH